jgi:hypothetical protein
MTKLRSNMKQTKQQLEEELRCIENNKKERAISDTLYAIKLVQQIVFGLVWFALITIAGALIYLVIKR